MRAGRKLQPVGTFVRVVIPHPREGEIGEVTEHLREPLKGWALVKFADGMISCLKAKHVRRENRPLILLAGQGE